MNCTLPKFQLKGYQKMVKIIQRMLNKETYSWREVKKCMIVRHYTWLILGHIFEHAT